MTILFRSKSKTLHFQFRYWLYGVKRDKRLSTSKNGYTLHYFRTKKQNTKIYRLQQSAVRFMKLFDDNIFFIFVYFLLLSQSRRDQGKPHSDTFLTSQTFRTTIALLHISILHKNVTLFQCDLLLIPTFHENNTTVTLNESVQQFIIYCTVRSFLIISVSANINN